MYGVDAALVPADVERIMRDTATDLGAPGFDIYYGWGRIDMAGALTALTAGQPAPAPEATPAPAPADTTAPTVRITSPADGSTVSGSVAIAAAATDDTGVTRVQFYANGGLIGTATTPPYSVRWSTRKLTGMYALTAVSYDAAGNASQPAAVTVTIATASTGKPPKK
jgi:hypothetical protein